MNYDKISYLVGAIFTLGLIFLTSILFNYGRSFIDDPSFDMYFGWYLGLVLLNLFNILVNLIYHYFMKDLIGPRGLKGEPGERGPPGKDDRCMCEGEETTAEFISLEGTDDIQSYGFTFQEGDTSGEINFSGIANQDGGSITLRQDELNQIKNATATEGAAEGATVDVAEGAAEGATVGAAVDPAAEGAAVDPAAEGAEDLAAVVADAAS